jgi:DNA-binding transcriptional MerR regulator
MSDFILSGKGSVTLVRVSRARPVRHSLEDAARLAGVRPETVRRYCRLGLLGPSRNQPGAEPTFDDDALYELRRIEHFRRHHGVSHRALPLVCGLLRQVERLHIEVRFLRSR